MPTLPARMRTVLGACAPLFSARVWEQAQVLRAGAILAPAPRGGHAARRVTGRAAWSELAVGRALLALLAATFAPTGPLLCGIDETLERRRQAVHDPGQRIAAKGIERDPVRSSHSHVGKASGRRWVCLMLLVPSPWAARVWMPRSMRPLRRAGPVRSDVHA
jgi:hypothetical protein